MIKFLIPGMVALKTKRKKNPKQLRSPLFIWVINCLNKLIVSRNTAYSFTLNLISFRDLKEDDEYYI